MNLTIVDVFAEKPLAGNQLAVVLDAKELTSEQMQSIAREMNFSETTFVTAEAEGRASVRIFTPSTELPFAGHPTVGTAWVLAGGTGSFTLDLAGGAVPVSFEDGIGWMTPPPVALNDVLDPERAGQLIGLTPEQLATGYSPRFAEVGPEFILIGVKDLTALRQAALNPALHRTYQQEGLAVAHVFIFTEDAYGTDADFASRMFFDAGGIREDPATGSANSAFAAYLKDLRGGSFEVVVDQGVEMKRPSRLYLRVGDVIQVGGRTQLVCRGEFAPEIL
ncbi:MAG: PhzF family phenazine biosynthesis protein [Myxococcota bacterium]